LGKLFTQRLPSSIIWYWPNGGMFFGCEGSWGLAQSSGSLLPAWWRNH